MFRERVATHYRARGYRVEEDMRLRADDGRIHHVDLVCKSGLGTLIVEIPDELDGTELASLRRKAKDLYGTPVLASPQIPVEIRNAAPRMGIVLLEEMDLQTEPDGISLPPPAPAPEPVPWPEPKRREAPVREEPAPAQAAQAVWPSQRREAPQKFAWLNQGQVLEAPPAPTPPDVVPAPPARAPPVPPAPAPRAPAPSAPAPMPRFHEPPEASQAMRPDMVRPAQEKPLAREPVRPHAPEPHPVQSRGVLEASYTLDIPTIPVGVPDPRDLMAGRTVGKKVSPPVEVPEPAQAEVAKEPREAPLLTLRQVAQAAVGGLVAGLVVVGLGMFAL